MTDRPEAPDDPIPSDLIRRNASFADIVQEFVERLPGRVNAMEQAFSSGDLESLRRAAHQLKGAGGGYGYAILTEVAGQMEKSALEKDLAAIRRELDDLKSLVSRVVVGLE